ncbi:MAG: sugar phosphate isomerase/epimerase [Verrucomicrobiales bacterium]|nr:sugar phosphate isomerase/epimerase [Verrucomicrobiales bacterium]
MNRRAFLASTAATLAATTSRSIHAAASQSGLLIGMDHFAVRGTEWTAAEYIDYGASLGIDTVFLSELKVFPNFEDAYLAQLKSQADRLGVKLYLGTGCICSTSKRWSDAHGTPEEHLKLTIRVAHALGSPVARCYLGGADDRSTDGGIERHIEQVVKTCQACKSYAQDHDIKIAVENHAGDMQSHELVGLIEAAGKDYVGANIDPGNAVWALEEPLRHLETLGPYTLCSSVRDSMIWETDTGVAVQWTAIGEGLVDFKAYAKRFAELAPGVPLQVETISGFSKPLNWHEDAFWKAYPKARAADFAAFLSMAQRGHPLEAYQAPDGPCKKDAQVAYQKAELERSLAWLKANV